MMSCCFGDGCGGGCHRKLKLFAKVGAETGGIPGFVISFVGAVAVLSELFFEFGDFFADPVDEGRFVVADLGQAGASALIVAQERAGGAGCSVGAETEMDEGSFREVQSAALMLMHGFGDALADQFELVRAGQSSGENLEVREVLAGGGDEGTLVGGRVGLRGEGRDLRVRGKRQVELGGAAAQERCGVQVGPHEFANGRRRLGRDETLPPPA